MTASGVATLSATTYRQKDCTIGVVHIGLGAFHRAHQAFYFDALMEATGDLSWGIAGVNLRRDDFDQFEATINDGNGYVLKSMSPTGQIDYAHIRAHIAFADWPSQQRQAEDLLSLASVKIVTMTVTESGYSLNEDGYLEPRHTPIAAEIAGRQPTTIYGFLRAGLNRRRLAGVGPITIMCCDNLHQNGARLAKNFGTYLLLCGDEVLIDWLKDNASFPCSMVDRITPKPTLEDAREVAALFGREHDPSVRAEDFVQWVIEDKFAAQKPRLELVGVQIVDDIAPFEDTKILVLNGGHTCLTYLAALKGHQTFDQAMADTELYEHFLRFETDEVAPSLDPDLPFDKVAYLATIAGRFQNANIADSLERICMDGVSKFPIYVLPTIESRLAAGEVPHYALRSVASWFIYAKRVACGELELNYIDPRKHVLTPFFEPGGAELFANSGTLWGDLPVRFPEFSTQLIEQINRLEDQFPLSEKVRDAI